MTKSRALKILNPILGLLVLSQMLSGMFGMQIPHQLFAIIHKKGAYLLLTAIILHVWLNWNWIKSAYFPSKSPRAK